MINLRYHIVSITAVFLALGIGIAMGSSFLSDAAVQQVDRNIDSARTEARNARAEASELRDDLSTRVERDAALLDQAVERLFRADLSDVPVVLLTVGGVDGDSLERLQTALASSQADFAGTLTVTDAVRATGDDADTVAGVLDAEGVSEPVLRSRLVAAVSEELLAAAAPADEDEEEAPPTTTTEPGDPDALPPEDPPDGTEPGDTTTTAPESSGLEPPGGQADEEVEPGASPDTVRALVAAGVLDYEPAAGGLPIEEALAAPGHRYVVVSGPDPDVADGAFLVPLLRRLAADGPAPVVVASAAVGDSAEDDRAAVVGPLVEDEVVGPRITTVDNLESLAGVAAVVLGLDDIGRDRLGHYGVGPTAESQLPEP